MCGMRCDEIQEEFIDLLYDDAAASHKSAELREHLRTCVNCRKELDKLKKTREYLQLWKDESPPQNITMPRREIHQPRTWSFLRYAGIAAMFLIALLALVNTQISWNKDGFSFSTSFFAEREFERNYYTKSEFRNIMKQALDDSEVRTNETNYLMMQRMLDTVEQGRWMDFHLIRGEFARNNKN
jgi:hypothetical protein